MTAAGPDIGAMSLRDHFLDEERQRFGLLLLAILTVFAIQGVASPAAWEQVVVALLLAGTLLLALRIANVRPWVFRIMLVLVLVLLGLSIGEAIAGMVDNAATRLANALLVALAPTAIIIGVLRSLRARQAVTVEAVLGVLSVYVLIGMFFAALYGSIDHIGSTPFFAQHVQATVSQCLYFSFTTLTTVGYGDLTAASNLGHTLSVTEALVGQIYLVTVVSVLIANLGRRRQVTS